MAMKWDPRAMSAVHSDELGRRMSQMQTYYERRESKLRSELDEYHRVSRVAGGRTRERRVAVTALDDSLTRRQLSVEPAQGTLDEFFALKIHRILPRAEDVHEDEEIGERRLSLPITLQAFVGRDYIVGPGGMVVGSGAKCTIQLPAEAGLLPQHFRLRANLRTMEGGPNASVPITWAYVLDCCMGGQDVLVLSGLEQLEDYEPGAALRGETHASLPLDGCNTFATGQVVWQVLPLPARSVTSLQAFAAARSRSLGKLRSVLQRQEERIRGLQGEALEAAIFDINSEEKQSDSCTLGADPSDHASQGSVSRSNLLLHIAVECEDQEMVTYLLEKGCNPNRTGGPHLRTALHIAAEKDNCAVLARLLQFGGDVEVRDINYLPPVALATGHQVRRLLLHAALLCSAALDNQFEEVEYYLNQPYLSPNALGLRHKTALHLASIAGHVSIAQLLISRGANVNQCGGARSRTALHYATCCHRRGVVEVLLDQAVDLAVRDADGNTAVNLCTDAGILKLISKEVTPTLCAVAQSGDLDAASRLLSSHLEGAGLGVGFTEQRDASFYTPLHIACRRGQLEMVKLLKAHGANVNILGGPDRLPPICDAARAGYVDIVEFLIGIGADIEGVSTNGDAFKVRDMVEEILEKYRQALSELRFHGRAPTNLPELSGVARQISQVTLSPKGPIEEFQEKMDQLEEVFGLLFSGPERLLRAYQDRDLKLFSDLLTGPNPVSPNCVASPFENISMLAYVCETEQYEYASKLISAGAEVNIVGTQDQMPLLLAADLGHLHVVQLLVENGADVNAQSCDTGSSALHEAAHSEERGIITYLIKYGADRTLRNSSGETPFDLAKSLECRRLLASGSQQLLIAACTGDVAALQKAGEGEGEGPSTLVFQHGWTVLHEACQWGQLGVVQELLQQGGVDLCRRGGYHLLTPLHLACMHNHVEVVRELLVQPDIRKSVSLKDRQGRVPYEVAATNQIRHLLVHRNPVRPTPTPYQRRSIDQNMCIVCRDSAVEVVLLPCAHKICCYNCAERCKDAMNACPICRSIIKNVEMIPA